MDVNDVHAGPAVRKGSSPPLTRSKAPITPLTNKNVFLEKYTDSPEFTHIDNPVVYMEQETLPEEEEEQARPRRHPLSQVMSAEDEQSLTTRPSWNSNSQQRVGIGASIEISDDGEEDEDEELDDDTFEFILR